MGDVLPIRWLGSTRRASVHSLVEARLALWAEGWASASEVSSFDDAAPPVGEHVWHVAASGDGTAAVGIATTGLAGFGAALAGCPVTGAGDLPRAIAGRALDDLARHLAGAGAHRREQTRTTRELSPQSGGATFTTSIGGFIVGMHVDAALAERLAPAGRSTRRALMRREDAIAPLSAALRVSLPLGHVPLTHLTSLQPGDVLRTSIRVGGLIQLTSDDGTVARVGHLVADGEHRAIRIQ